MLCKVECMCVGIGTHVHLFKSLMVGPVEHRHFSVRVEAGCNVFRCVSAINMQTDVLITSAA